MDDLAETDSLHGRQPLVSHPAAGVYRPIYIIAHISIVLVCNESYGGPVQTT